ncbi:hypothetical protein [Nocardia jinanensis]|uniref:Uncharacterized protein n=1 Tax=Nocardia jinanensis TaxID=382504 RepID=A0A917RUW1_9NOCA|nr:hypothetical protein [Nocardia jinanensis]GGL36827.1 hypothetical protein GCM10011588_59430 [Nocardia jinanensis]
MQITTDPVTGVTGSVAAEAAGAATTLKDKAIALALAAKSLVILADISRPPVDGRLLS